MIFVVQHAIHVSLSPENMPITESKWIYRMKNREKMLKMFAATLNLNLLLMDGRE
jgi:hypothetical protein